VWVSVSLAHHFSAQQFLISYKKRWGARFSCSTLVRGGRFAGVFAGSAKEAAASFALAVTGMRVVWPERPVLRLPRAVQGDVERRFEAIAEVEVVMLFA